MYIGKKREKVKDTCIVFMGPFKTDLCATHFPLEPRKEEEAGNVARSPHAASTRLPCSVLCLPFAKAFATLWGDAAVLHVTATLLQQAILSLSSSLSPVAPSSGSAPNSAGWQEFHFVLLVHYGHQAKDRLDSSLRLLQRTLQMRRPPLPKHNEQPAEEREMGNGVEWRASSRASNAGHSSSYPAALAVVRRLLHEVIRTWQQQVAPSLPSFQMAEYISSRGTLFHGVPSLSSSTAKASVPSNVGRAAGGVGLAFLHLVENLYLVLRDTEPGTRSPCLSGALGTSLAKVPHEEEEERARQCSALLGIPVETILDVYRSTLKGRRGEKQEAAPPITGEEALSQQQAEGSCAVLPSPPLRAAEVWAMEEDLRYLQNVMFASCAPPRGARQEGRGNLFQKLMQVLLPATATTRVTKEPARGREEKGTPREGTPSGTRAAVAVMRGKKEAARQEEGTVRAKSGVARTAAEYRKGEIHSFPPPSAAVRHVPKASEEGVACVPHTSPSADSAFSSVAFTPSTILAEGEQPMRTAGNGASHHNHPGSPLPSHPLHAKTSLHSALPRFGVSGVAPLLLISTKVCSPSSLSCVRSTTTAAVPTAETAYAEAKSHVMNIKEKERLQRKDRFSTGGAVKERMEGGAHENGGDGEWEKGEETDSHAEKAGYAAPEVSAAWWIGLGERKDVSELRFFIPWCFPPHRSGRAGESTASGVDSQASSEETARKDEPVEDRVAKAELQRCCGILMGLHHLLHQHSSSHFSSCETMAGVIEEWLTEEAGLIEIFSSTTGEGNKVDEAGSEGASPSPKREPSCSSALPFPFSTSPTTSSPCCSVSSPLLVWNTRTGVVHVADAQMTGVVPPTKRKAKKKRMKENTQGEGHQPGAEMQLIRASPATIVLFSRWDSTSSSAAAASSAMPCSSSPSDGLPPTACSSLSSSATGMRVREGKAEPIGSRLPAAPPTLPAWSADRSQPSLSVVPGKGVVFLVLQECMVLEESLAGKLWWDATTAKKERHAMCRWWRLEGKGEEGAPPPVFPFPSPKQKVRKNSRRDPPTGATTPTGQNRAFRAGSPKAKEQRESILERRRKQKMGRGEEVVVVEGAEGKEEAETGNTFIFSSPVLNHSVHSSLSVATPATEAAASPEVRGAETVGHGDGKGGREEEDLLQLHREDTNQEMENAEEENGNASADENEEETSTPIQTAAPEEGLAVEEGAPLFIATPAWALQPAHRLPCLSIGSLDSEDVRLPLATTPPSPMTRRASSTLACGTVGTSTSTNKEQADVDTMSPSTTSPSPSPSLPVPATSLSGTTAADAASTSVVHGCSVVSPLSLSATTPPSVKSPPDVMTRTTNTTSLNLSRTMLTIRTDRRKGKDYLFCPVVRRNNCIQRSVTFVNLRILIFYYHECHSFISWMLSLNHSVTAVNRTDQMEHYLRCGIGVYDIVHIEWDKAIISPWMVQKLQAMCREHLTIPVLCLVLVDNPEELMEMERVKLRLGDGKVGEGSYPLPPHCPPVPPDLPSMYLLYGPDLMRTILSKRGQLREEVFIGQILKAIRGDLTCRYTVTRKIGSGSFGDVYEVRPRASSGLLAMKRIPIGEHLTTEKMDQLYEEVAIMRAMDHKNVILLSHVTCDAEFLNVFMELCDGSLDDVLQEVSSRTAGRGCWLISRLRSAAVAAGGGGNGLRGRMEERILSPSLLPSPGTSKTAPITQYSSPSSLGAASSPLLFPLSPSAAQRPQQEILPASSFSFSLSSFTQPQGPFLTTPPSSPSPSGVPSSLATRWNWAAAAGEPGGRFLLHSCRSGRGDKETISPTPSAASFSLVPSGRREEPQRAVQSGANSRRSSLRRRSSEGNRSGMHPASRLPSVGDGDTPAAAHFHTPIPSQVVDAGGMVETEPPSRSGFPSSPSPMLSAKRGMVAPPIDVSPGSLGASVSSSLTVLSRGSSPRGVTLARRSLVAQVHFAHLFRDILSGIQYIHSRNVIHRDIKPHNILLSKGVAKLADFGCAISLSGLAREERHAMKGTLPYMAPEVFLGESYGAPCDIWSMGVLIAEVLGVHLAHSLILHFPGLQEFYEGMKKEECMPVVITSFVKSTNTRQHYSDSLIRSALDCLKEAQILAREERAILEEERSNGSGSRTLQQSGSCPSFSGGHRTPAQLSTTSSSPSCSSGVYTRPQKAGFRATATRTNHSTTIQSMAMEQAHPHTIHTQESQKIRATTSTSSISSSAGKSDLAQPSPSSLSGATVPGILRLGGRRASVTGTGTAEKDLPLRTVLNIEVGKDMKHCTTTIHTLPASLIELLEKCFCLSPEKRITAEQLLQHPIAKDEKWIEQMLLKVYQLNKLIYEENMKRNSREGSSQSYDFSMSVGTSQNSSVNTL